MKLVPHSIPYDLNRPQVRAILRLLLLFVVYFAVGKLGMALAPVKAGTASVIWLPTGLALAAMLLYGDGVWPSLLLGAWLVAVTTTGSLAASLAIAIGNTLEALVAAHLVGRFAHGIHAFDRTQDVFKFVLLAGLASPVITAIIGAGSLSWSGLAAWSNFGSICLRWWFGDGTAVLVIAPLVILWATNHGFLWRRRQTLEATLLLATLLVVALLEFGGWLPLSSKDYPVEFVLLPIVVWAAFRFGQREVVTLAALLAGIAIWGTERGFGPFARTTPNAAMLLLQAFIDTAVVMGLALAAAVGERRRSEAELQKQKEILRLSNDQLAVILQNAGDAILAQDRTGHLRYANDPAARLNGYPSAQALVAAPRSDSLDQFDVYDEAGQSIPPERLPGRLALQTAAPAAATIRYRNRKTGEEHWSWDKATPILDATGQVEFVINVLHDITDLKRGELERQLLADASRLLSAPMEWDARLFELSQLVVPLLADLCAVHVSEPDDTLRLLALTRSKPLAAKEAERDWQTALGISTRTLLEVMHTSRPLLDPEIAEHPVEANAPPSNPSRQLRTCQPRSAMVVPLMSRGRTFGTLTLMWSASDHRYRREDLVLAEDLARQASLAADNAWLYQDAQQARQGLEQQVQQRTAELLQSELHFKALVDSVQDYAIYMLSPEGLVASWNTGAVRLKGYTADEIIGQHYRRFYLPEDAQQGQPERNLATARRLGHFEAEGWRVRKDGSQFWANVVITPVLGAGGELIGYAKVTRDLTERKRAEDELRHSEEHLRQLTAHLQSLREEESARIAREIHDVLGGALTGLKMDVAHLRRKVEGLDSTITEKLGAMVISIDGAIQLVRQVATELRPAILDDFGLLAALEWQLGEFERRSGIHGYWQCELEDVDLGARSPIAIFRVFQESLTNIARHAHATEVHVTVTLTVDRFQLTIEDNGIGIAPDRVRGTGSLGLVGMRERMSALGGTVDIRPGLQGGTMVQVTVPCPT